VAYYHRSRLTAAAAVALAKTGLYLVRIRVWATTTPGLLSLQLDSTTKALFPAPSNGTRGYATFEVNEKMETNNIDSTFFTFVQGLSVVELTFSDQPNPKGQPLKNFRGAYSVRDDTGGAATADITLTFTGVTGAKPSGAMVLGSASAGRLIFSQAGGLTHAIESLVSERIDQLAPVPDFGENLVSLTASLVSDGAQKLAVVMHY